MSRTPGTDAAKELNSLIARGRIDGVTVTNSLLATIADELGGIRDVLDELVGKEGRA